LYPKTTDFSDINSLEKRRIEPVIGDNRTLMLDGTVEVRKGPATVVVITDTRLRPCSLANLNAASSVSSFDNM